MALRIRPIEKRDEFQQAGPNDLVRLRPLPGRVPLVLPKKLLEVLCAAIVHAEFTHVSGPTGTAKTSLIESFYRVPENFPHVCASLGFPTLPLRVYPVEMAIY
ncbi:MAG: hypothetical protein WCA12_17370, partial [Burkholderiales bacterium]